MNGLDNNYYKQLRLSPTVAGDKILSRRTYNMILMGTLAWGFVIDIIMCRLLGDTLLGASPLMVIVAYAAVSLISIIVIHRSDSAVISFLAFTALAAAMGLALAIIVPQYTGETVTDAFFITAAVCLVTGILASIFPNFFLKMGRGLFMSLIVMVIVEILSMILFHTVPTITSIVIVVIFSGYLGHDLVVAQKYKPTADNAVDSAADVYVDVINIFIRVLSILGNRN